MSMVIFLRLPFTFYICRIFYLYTPTPFPGFIIKLAQFTTEDTATSPIEKGWKNSEICSAKVSLMTKEVSLMNCSRLLQLIKITCYYN